MESVARLRNFRGSPRKARLVADEIRGRDVYQALSFLKFSHRKSSPGMEKLLESAIANWVQKNEGYKPEDSELFVKEIFVDGAQVIKRFLPAPQGRAFRIRKRNSHITIKVDSRVVVDMPVEAETEEVENEQTTDQVE